MTDVTFALAAKSDQLNAADLAVPRVIRVRDVHVDPTALEQRVWVFFDGDQDRPWKPSTGMLRVLSACWGTESDDWIGQHAEIICDPSVVYGGKEVGGIRVTAVTGIDARGLDIPLSISRQKRIIWHVKNLQVQTREYPADKFDAGFDAMSEAMQSGKMSLADVIARCQKTGTLTAEQVQRLEDAAPAIAEGDEG